MESELYPSIALSKKNSEIYTNFGEGEFVFQIDSYISSIKNKLYNEILGIDSYKSLDLKVIVKEADDLSNIYELEENQYDIICEYLEVQGYTKTLDCLRKKDINLNNVEIPLQNGKENRNAFNQTNFMKLIYSEIKNQNFEQAFLYIRDYFPNCHISSSYLQLIYHLKGYLNFPHQASTLIESKKERYLMVKQIIESPYVQNYINTTHFEVFGSIVKRLKYTILLQNTDDANKFLEDIINDYDAHCLLINNDINLNRTQDYIHGLTTIELIIRHTNILIRQLLLYNSSSTIKIKFLLQNDDLVSILSKWYMKKYYSSFSMIKITNLINQLFSLNIY